MVLNLKQKRSAYRQEIASRSLLLEILLYLYPKTTAGDYSIYFWQKNKKNKNFQSRDASIIDVRTAAEYAQGAISGSKYIPLQEIGSKINQIKNGTLL
ncbi:MAG: hypothetical protein ACI828_002388 [Flavobacteriales bacterium]